MRELGAPTGRPTINDVARLAGVSKKTVSRVINDSPHVQERTREVVRTVIEQTGYVPDPHARSLALGKALLIGFVYDRDDTRGVLEIQQGLLAGLAGSGFELVVRCVDPKAPSVAEDLRTFVDGQKLFGLAFAPAISACGAAEAWGPTLNCRCLSIIAGAATTLGEVGYAAARRLTAAPPERGTGGRAAR